MADSRSDSRSGSPPDSHSPSTLVVGAGPVGLALGLALAANGQRPCLVDARGADAGLSDARVLALSHGSRQMLERLGAWPQQATPIQRIHISQRGHLGRTVLATQDYKLPALGYVIPAGELFRTLQEALTRRGLTVLHDTSVAATEQHEGGLQVQLAGTHAQTLRLQLLAYCEGRIAQTEAAAQIREHDYGQHAVVARVRIADAHEHVAFERFTPEGPLALLPLGEDYSVVWTASPARAASLVVLPEAAFLEALQAAFGTRVRFVGAGERASFPLMLRVRQQAIGHRCVWLGNAAQTLHPVAGQGFNLALRDVWTLAQILAGATDAGDAGLLARYAQGRMLDRSGTVHFTDGLVRLFSRDDPLLGHLRGAGLLALDALPPLRHFVAKRMLFGARAWP
ncbi:FAD-dependent monooxygenase [Niveibacterium sp. SC-1]|uniref:FAD-dependent monooxygenase n=1 Tax=Niveibacterium sp. SC-1 TaxID=3135646 RepID=UPI00311D8814